MEPDGYPQWLLQVEQEEAARKAAKETGALLLTGPAVEQEANGAPVVEAEALAIEGEMPAALLHVSLSDAAALVAEDALSLAQKRPRRH